MPSGPATSDTTPLRRLVYTSRYLAHRDRDFMGSVNDIVAYARINNRLAGVTGALMIKAGHFAQVLEGPAAIIKPLYGRIACDPRHGRVLLLGNEEIEERAFPDWSMGYVGEPDDADIRLIAPTGAQIGTPEASASAILNLLRALVELSRNREPLGTA